MAVHFGRRGGGEEREKLRAMKVVRYRRSGLELVVAAARERGESPAAYIRRASVEAARRDLSDHSKASR